MGLKVVLLSCFLSSVAFADGKALFQNNCAVCHGDGGKGDGPASSAMNPRPRNLVSDPLKNSDIANTLKNGLPGTQMPSFSQLSDEDRAALVEYVKSLRK